MIAGEEEEHGCETIIKALTKALTDLKGSSLKCLTFDWNSSEQFEYFRLFIKEMESWYILQGITDKAGDTTRLEYLLNFLGPIGCRNHEQWNPSGATPEEQEKNEKNAKLFMDFLHSSMDHQGTPGAMDKHNLHSRLLKDCSPMPSALDRIDMFLC